MSDEPYIDPSSFPPVRGVLNTNAYVFRFIRQNSTDMSNYILVQVTASQENAPNNIQNFYCFTPCLIPISGTKNFQYNINSNLERVTKFVIGEQTWDIQNVGTVSQPVDSITPIPYSISYSGGEYNISTSNGKINFTLDYIDTFPNPVSDPKVLYVSFPYNLSIAKDSDIKLYTFPPSTVLQNSNPHYFFSYVDGSDSNPPQLEETSEFTSYFIPATFHIGTGCNDVNLTLSVLSFISSWSQINTPNLNCPVGFVEQNQNCGWTDISQCEIGFFYEYCTSADAKTCEHCYGICPANQVCQELDKQTISNSNNIAFSCNVPPPAPPAPPRPAPSNTTSFWKKYGKSIIITSIILGVFIFLAIFVGWIIPKNSEKVQPIPVVVTKPAPPPEIVNL